eukprot:7362952-Prymnesium_polylepis.1
MCTRDYPLFGDRVFEMWSRAGRQLTTAETHAMLLAKYSNPFEWAIRQVEQQWPTDFELTASQAIKFIRWIDDPYNSTRAYSFSAVRRHLAACKDDFRRHGQLDTTDFKWAKRLGSLEQVIRQQQAASCALPLDYEERVLLDGSFGQEASASGGRKGYSERSERTRAERAEAKEKPSYRPRETNQWTVTVPPQ